MKKCKMIIVSLLVGIFVFNTPIHILAATEGNNTNAKTGKMIDDINVKEYVVDKSVEAFPEFAAKIKGENTEEIQSALLRRSGIGEVIYTETRMISENEMVTYTEYDSGIAATAYGLMEGKNVTQSYWEGNRWTYVMNVWLQYGGSESVLFVEGFEYEKYTYGNDKITESGDCTSMSSAVSPILENLTDEEKDGKLARAQYGAIFVFYVNYGDLNIPYYLYAHLIVEVGADTCVISSRAEDII